MTFSDNSSELYLQNFAKVLPHSSFLYILFSRRSFFKVIFSNNPLGFLKDSKSFSLDTGCFFNNSCLFLVPDYLQSFVDHLTPTYESSKCAKGMQGMNQSQC